MTAVSLRQHTRPPSPPPAMTTRTLLLLRRRSQTTTTTPFVPLSPPELHTARGFPFDVGATLSQHLSGIATGASSLTHLPSRAPTLHHVSPPESSMLHRRVLVSTIPLSPPEPPVPPDPPPNPLKTAQAPANLKTRTRIDITSLVTLIATPTRHCFATNHRSSPSSFGEVKTFSTAPLHLITNRQLQAEIQSIAVLPGHQKVRPPASPAHDGNRARDPTLGEWIARRLESPARPIRASDLPMRITAGHCSAVDKLPTLPRSPLTANLKQGCLLVLWASTKMDCPTLMGLSAQKYYEPINFFNYLHMSISANAISLSKSSTVKVSRALNFVHPLIIVGELPLSKERRLLSTIVTNLSLFSRLFYYLWIVNAH